VIIYDLTLTKVLHKGVFIGLNEYGNAILAETIDGKTEEITVCDGRMRLDPGNSSVAWEELRKDDMKELENDGNMHCVKIIFFYFLFEKMSVWKCYFHIQIKWQNT